MTRDRTWWSGWRRGWTSTPQTSPSSRMYRHKHPVHTHIVTNNDLLCSLKAIHRIKDNWPHLRRFCFALLSSWKQTEGCPDATRTVCVKTLGHTASDCRRLLFFWPFGVFDFAQGEKSGLITSRHTLMSLLYSKHCLATIVTIRLVKKRAVKPSNDSQLEAKRGRERKGSSSGSRAGNRESSPAGGG